MRVSVIAAAALLAVTGSAFAASSTSALGGASVSANISDLGNPPPASAIVTNAGLEWVWASPCPGAPNGCGGNNTGVTLHSGFGFASAAQWGTWGTLAAFQGAWGGVTCASPQFSNNFDNCDASDLVIGLVYGSTLAGADPGNFFAETFLVRAVPEPGTYSLMFVGLGLVGMIARRRKQPAV